MNFVDENKSFDLNLQNEEINSPKSLSVSSQTTQNTYKKTYEKNKSAYEIEEMDLSFASLAGAVSNVKSTTQNLVASTENWIPDQLEAVGAAVVDNVSSSFNNALENAKKLTSDIIDGIEKNISDTNSVVTSKSKSVLDFIGEKFDEVKDATWHGITQSLETLERTGASIANTLVGVAQGFAEFGEAIFDTGTIVVTAAGSIFSGLYDGYQWIKGKITGDESWESATKEFWDTTMNFVAKKHMTEIFDDYHENDVIGKWLNEKSYAPFKSTGTVYKIADGVGYIGGIITLTLATMGVGTALSGGSSAAAVGTSAATTTATTASSSAGTLATIHLGNVATVNITTKAVASGAVAATAGFGKNTQNAWSDGASLGEGLAYGTAMGAWEGFEMILGASINTLKLSGFTGLKGQLLNTFTHVGLDSIDGASSSFVNPVMQMIYTPTEEQMAQILYLVNYDENGNQLSNKKWEDLTFTEKYNALFKYNGGWSGVGTNAITAGVVSLLTEIPDIKAAIKPLSQLDALKKIKDLETKNGIQLFSLEELDKIKNGEIVLTSKDIQDVLDAKLLSASVAKTSSLSPEVKEFLDKYLKDPDITIPTGIPGEVIEFIKQFSEDPDITIPTGIPREIIDYVESTDLKKAVGETQTTTTSGLTTTLYKEGTPDYFNQLDQTSAQQVSKYQSQLSDLSKKFGVSETKMQQLLDKKIRKLVESSDFGKRTKLSTLERMLDTDRFMKTQFETGTSGGAFDPELRKTIEEELFCVPRDIADVDRPLYGMCIPNVDKSSSRVLSSYITDGPGHWYGGGDGCMLVFDKDKVLNNATITVGDSLDYQNSVIGTTATNPTFKGGFDAFLNDIDNTRELSKASLQDLFPGFDRYLEVQLHGQASHSLDAIKEVIFTNSKPSAELISKLEAQGISWRILGD